MLEPAFNYVMSHEDSTLSGHVTPDPTADDPKAVQRFGVNSAAHPELIAEGFYRDMPREDALEIASRIFKYAYFSTINGYQIKDQDICNKFSDLAFNEGCHQATKIVQRALGMGGQVDGFVGNLTLNAINGADPISLMVGIKKYATQFYQDWALREHKSDDELRALLKRVNS